MDEQKFLAVILDIKDSHELFNSDNYYEKHIDIIYKMMDGIIDKLEEYEYEFDDELIRHVPPEERTSIWVENKDYFRQGDLFGFSIKEGVLVEKDIRQMILNIKKFYRVKYVFHFAVVSYRACENDNDVNLYKAICDGEKISKKNKKEI